MRTNPYYITYYTTLTRLLFLGVFPFSLLLFFNYKIYCKIQLPSIVEALPELERSTRKNQENDLARVLIGIVFIFIVCHSLRVLTDIYEMINISSIIACHNAGRIGVSSWLIQLHYFSKLMISTNASISMFIYCLINKGFRRKLFVWRNNQSKISRQTENISDEGIRMRRR